ncbi:LysR family transcriptional regulator [Paraburkholderia caballeronis]|uniref:LysR family transcriptional regulator n=1 Tax=Paraburkholderia caballeronis TaxID=416943 RepID=UPI001066AAFE|nr:LysR family transcriptional regulator [Paraburkholderia caballeronis]TDV34406.1 LysR family transcriptional regulator [Paraburkholderia caballeronis]
MDIPQLRYSLRQLRYFVVTAEVLSFTAAARKLHISQPSISTALAELEASFDVQLFIRHHASGLSLTTAGRDMLGLARNLLKNAEELQASARELDGGMSGTIALGCLASLAPPLMPMLISRFLSDFPGVQFDTHEAHQDDLLRGLHDGTLDLALTYSLDLEDDIAFMPLATLPPYAILPERHPLAGTSSVALADLLDEPYVQLDLPHSREYFMALFDPLGRRPVPAFRSAQPEVVRGLVANGLGYSILNFPLKSTRTTDGADFVMRPFRDEVTATTLGIAQSRSMKPRQIIKRFAEFCEAHVHALRQIPSSPGDA